MIDHVHPTLIVDEVDAVFRKKNDDGQAPDIRAVLNSGYRANKRVWRCNGSRNELRAFEIYGPRC
jgi:hypothetical protein